MMDTIGEDGLFRHPVPVPFALRLFLVVAGLFVVTVATWELHPGVWPPNITSPFFLFLILGAWSVGGPVAWAGLNGAAGLWIVGPGRIVIERKRPFLRLRRDTFGENDDMHLEVVEVEAMEGDSTWSVILSAKDGRRFETREFRTRAAAERLLKRIETAFAATEPLKPRRD
ncbi:hypothetical protein [Shinella sp.]|uniref:hypothetical protein n=1 Tax=Shinella sp. TaxID=1870904 RepID=UPI002E0DD48C